MEDAAAGSMPDEPSIPDSKDASFTGNAPLPGAAELKCTHYERHCAFVTPCCFKLYICRLCHNDVENHELNRHAVNEVQCLACDARQPVVHNCIRCGASFGKYFCEICRMYDDKDRKQFHCDACGICRVGGRDMFFHCPKCDMCLGKDLEGSHQCVERVTHSNCPICLEDLHTSTANLHVLKCGHITHKACYQAMLGKGIFACPYCGCSTYDMSDFWSTLDQEIRDSPMPEEYRDLKVWILCKDCHKTTEAAFHVVGLKCAECGSYNSCRTGDPDPTSKVAAAKNVQTNSADTVPNASLLGAPGDVTTSASNAFVSVDGASADVTPRRDDSLDALLAVTASVSPRFNDTEEEEEAASNPGATASSSTKHN